MKKIVNLTVQPVGFRMGNSGMVMSPKASMLIEDEFVENDRYLKRLSDLRIIKVVDIKP